MIVTLWGTRGSVPSPGPETVRYGGNTACVQVALADGTQLILDAGTGIRRLGRHLLDVGDQPPIVLLITHAHWDHVHGFPFFRPANCPQWPITVAGWSHSIQAIRDLMHLQMNGRNYPLEFAKLRADIGFLDLGLRTTRIRSAELRIGSCCHPGGCASYRIAADGAAMLHVTDNELRRGDRQGDYSRAELLDLARGVDLMIHDAQFLPEELPAHRGWGHSSYEGAIDLAAEAQVKRLVLFHHDPDRSDDEVDAIELRAREYIIKQGYRLECDAGAEGMSFEL